MRIGHEHHFTGLLLYLELSPIAVVDRFQRGDIQRILQKGQPIGRQLEYPKVFDRRNVLRPVGLNLDSLLEILRQIESSCDRFTCTLRPAARKLRRRLLRAGDGQQSQHPCKKGRDKPFHSNCHIHIPCSVSFTILWYSAPNNHPPEVHIELKKGRFLHCRHLYLC